MKETSRDTLVSTPPETGTETTTVPLLTNTDRNAPDSEEEVKRPPYKVFRKKKLEGFFLFVTSACNSHCKTCFYHDELNSNRDMSFEEIKKMSETAPPFDKLWISGGEPFMRKDLVEIIKLFYDNNHARVVNLPTNGLLTNRIVEGVGRLIEECPELEIHLNFSLDGLGKTHDKVRGVPGNFRTTIRTMEITREKFRHHPLLHQNVATVITPEGRDEAYDLGVYLLKKDLIDVQFFEVVRGDPLDPEVKNLTREELRALRKKVFPLIVEQGNRMFRHFSGLKKKIARFYYLGFIRFVNEIQDANYFAPTPWGMRCTAGETTIVIDHDGSYRACEVRDAIGRMQEHGFDIGKALSGKAMQQEIAEIGGGNRANCWCTHGCWILSSIKFSPQTMLFRIPAAYSRAKKDMIKDYKLPDIDLEAIEHYMEK